MAQLYFGRLTIGGACYIAAYKAGILGDKVLPNMTHWQIEEARTVIVSGPKKGCNLSEVSPAAKTPTLVLKDGTVLTEASAVLQWIADQSPESGLAPPAGTTARYQLMAQLNWVASELQPPFLALVNPASPPDAKEFNTAAVKAALAFLETHVLPDRQFLLGGDFTIADAYLCQVLGVVKYLGFMDEFPVVKGYLEGVRELDFVVQARSAMQALLMDNSEHLKSVQERAVMEMT